MSSHRSQALEELLAVVDALREPGGCPWDRKQTVGSMARYVLEEAYELVEAIEKEDDEHTAEEVGDLLMVLAMICRIAGETGRFDLERAARGIREKIVRRHPHVFGDVEAADAEEALASWEAVKAEERRAAEVDASALAGLPVAMAALARAGRTCDKAVAAGFRWASPAGAWAKVEEELGELRAALAETDLDAGERVELAPEIRGRVEDELGDLLMAGAFFGRYLGLDPEQLCRAALRRFEARFRDMEARLGGSLDGRALSELMEAWTEAKASAEG